MRKWWLLAGAIATEVTGTMALAGATDQPWLYAVTAVGELTSFFLLVKVLQAGMPLGVAYGVWSALGVAATAVLSLIFLDEVFTGVMVLGLVLIVGGVVLIEVGSHPAELEATDGVGVPGRCDRHRGRLHPGAPRRLRRPSTVVRRGRHRYAVSFGFLSLALDAGMGIGVAYGVWTAIGVAATAVLSKVFWDEPLTPLMVAGITLIAAASCSSSSAPARESG